MAELGDGMRMEMRLADFLRTLAIEAYPDGGALYPDGGALYPDGGALSFAAPSAV